MDNKLSLVAQYDDLIRMSNSLIQGVDPEFLSFVRYQEENRKQWLKLEEQVRELLEANKQLKKERLALDTKLKHARSQIECEMQARAMVEHDRDMLERQISLIRELLNDKNRTLLNEKDKETLAFLNSYQRVGSTNGRKSAIDSSGSVLSPSDISYDKTGEDFEDIASMHTYKRSGDSFPTGCHGDVPPRKKRSLHENSTIVATTSITVGNDGNPLATTTEVTVPKLNKSFSEPALETHLSKSSDSDEEENRDMIMTPLRRYGKRKQAKGTPSEQETPLLRKANSAGSGLNRMHDFISKTVIRPETCTPCGKKIKFSRLAMKCKDCKAVCHSECKDYLPVPCIPTMAGTPGNTRSDSGIISDFAPTEPPRIPGIIIHCVNEIEARGLSEVGLYRISGYEKQVKELKEKFFRGRGTPNLSAVDDIHVVCGCLKDFLRGLKEPLITYYSWKCFINASGKTDRTSVHNGLYEAIDQLPQPNRDTLAFLILHLLRVAQSPECKMPISNIARVFGPTIVGYSQPSPEPLQIVNETKHQAMVVEQLMDLPEDYWINFIYCDPNRPETPSGPVFESMLGPVSTPGSGKKFTTTVSYTPRFGLKSKQTSKRPRHFFASPTVD